MRLNPDDMMTETGEESRAWNEQEFVAKQIARADGKNWDQLPTVSTLWFKDKMHFRYLAQRALAAKRLWDTYRVYTDAKAASEKKAKRVRSRPTTASYTHQAGKL